MSIIPIQIRVRRSGGKLSSYSYGDSFPAAAAAAAAALCVIFTILVSFLRDNALFASKAKINFF